MVFDGLFLHSMVNELNKELAGGRINKIALPFPNELIITVRSFKKNRNLLLSAHPVMSRAQITKTDFENPITAPNFVMVLRRNLQGGKIIDFQQVGNDRILVLNIANANEIGDKVSFQLVLEIMGRHSNIFLLDNKRKIIELIKHVPAFENRVRVLLPGAEYEFPPSQGKADPFSSSEFISDDPRKILEHYQGFSRQSANEAAAAPYLTNWLKKFNQPDPTLTISDDSKTEFTAFSYLTLKGRQQKYSSLSELLDNYYQNTARQSRVRELSSQIHQIVKNELKKNERKASRIQEDLKKSLTADDFRVKGELLTAFQQQIQRGQNSITLNNYYSGKPIKIDLDPKISANANAQKYFKKYGKLKKSGSYLRQQLSKANQEIDYFSSIKEQLDNASPKDLDQIKLELVIEGYLKDKEFNKRPARKRTQAARPDLFISSDGTRIEVGKNNYQNDRLSLKEAKKNDIWLHVQKMPGSHVIIHDSDPSKQTLLEAAQLAAYFSKGKKSANVPVDYLPAGHLRKPNGAKPGFVIFQGQKTIFVTPDQNIIDKLKKEA